MPPQDRGQTPPDGVLEVYTEIRELIPTRYESLLWKIRRGSFNSHTASGDALIYCMWTFNRTEKHALWPDAPQHLAIQPQQRNSSGLTRTKPSVQPLFV